MNQGVNGAASTEITLLRQKESVGVTFARDNRTSDPVEVTLFRQKESVGVTFARDNRAQILWKSLFSDKRNQQE